MILLKDYQHFVDLYFVDFETWMFWFWNSCSMKEFFLKKWQPR